METHSSVHGESHGQRSLAGYSHRVTKNHMQLKRLSMHTHNVWDMVTTTHYLNRLNNGPSKEGHILISRNYEYGT